MWHFLLFKNRMDYRRKTRSMTRDDVLGQMYLLKNVRVSLSRCDTEQSNMVEQNLEEISAENVENPMESASATENAADNPMETATATKRTG